MAKFRLEAFEAQPYEGGFSVAYRLDGQRPFQMRDIEARNTAEALAALEAYKAEAAALGKPLACSITLCPRNQRAPAGFRTARTFASQNPVNV
jgi:hypothetical protein